MEILEEIAKNKKVDIYETEKFWSFAIPLISQLQSDGASFLIKADGERETNVFTVVIEGGLLGDDYLRCETNNVEEGIRRVISDYSQKFWR